MKYPKGPRITVNVRKELIAAAVPADSAKCMIAEAIKEAYPAATHVAVDVQTCRFSDLEKGRRFVYITPYAAALALLHFDEGKKPDAFSFMLKNAHVTRAGATDGEKQRKKRARAKMPKKAILVGGKPSSGNLPRKVGGRRPPQLRMLRQFGVRAFRGASTERLKKIALEAVQSEVSS